MRLRSILLPLVAVGTWACRSADTSTDVDSSAPQGNSELAADTTPHVTPPSAALPEGAPLGTLSEPVLAGTPQDPDDILDQEAQRQAVRDQAYASLVESYIAQGDAARDIGDTSAALTAYSNALEVDPSSADAKDRLRSLAALMGDKFAAAPDMIEDLGDRDTIRRAQARMSAEQAIVDAEGDLRAGRYDDAILAYREAQTILQYHPLIADESLDAVLVDGMLNRAIDMREDARAEEARQQALAAQEAKDAEERHQQENRERQLRTLYRNAQDAFLSDNFSLAESLARQILVMDPKNATAAELRDIAIAARHRQHDQTTRRNYREQWQKTFEELDTMDIPQTDPVVFDDLERWAKVIERKPTAFSSLADPQMEADRAAVLAKLDTVRFSPNFVGPDGDGAEITEIANFLQNLSGVNFLVSQLALDDPDLTPIKLQLSERSVLNVLELIATTTVNLRWKIQDGVVKFVTQEEMVGGQVLQMYEVRDIIHPIPHFPGRDINVNPSGMVPEIDEELPDLEGLVVTADALETLIHDNIDPQSWEDDPINSIRITDNGTLVVFQTPEVHEKISALLDDLRKSTGIMVDIRSNFLKVEDNFLEDIGIDFRGLGQPGLGTNTFFNDFGDASTQQELGNEIGQSPDLGAFLNEGNDGDIRARTEQLYDLGLGDDETIRGAGGLTFQWTYLNDLQMEMILRAVSKSERIELVTEPRLLVFNGARSNITVLNQIAYVQDFDVEIAQAASIADPIVAVIQDGVVLDVRPVVSADRRFILMELRPTVATLQRPIQEVATSLGSQASVSIQLPELDIQRVRTTISMPDKGTVMLGGLKVSEKQNYDSGIPILNKIPVLSFFFSRKGTYVSNRKLMILVRAEIVILGEREPTPAQVGAYR